MGFLFLLLSLLAAWMTYNAYRPSYAGVYRATLSFFAGWLTSELALHHILGQALTAVLFIWAGALQTTSGQLALTIMILCWLGLWHVYWRATSTPEAIERELQRGLGADYASTILPEVAARFPERTDWKSILLPFPLRHPEVERIRGLQYARAAGLNLKLDVYRHASRPTGCPTLLQIHGGAWCVGSKDEQGIPLMLHLAARGWVCVTANYRLSPHATFPEHLVDLKRALAWIREYGAEYGADPGFVIVTGGSAGGHLATLMALTANEPEYQPGFEDADTSVQGCVSFYGVYDFTDRHRTQLHDGLRRVLERRVLKASLDEAPEAYGKASPLDRIHSDAPPFLVIHGDLDSLAPVEQARHFCAAFRATAQAPLVYFEVAGAQHAFEIFPSLRTAHVVHGVERFVGYLYSRHCAAPAVEAQPTMGAGAQRAD
jgi:acetyl esterase/lipase